MNSNNGNSISNPTLTVNASPFVPPELTTNSPTITLQRVAKLSEDLLHLHERIFSCYSQKDYEKKVFSVSGELLPVLKQLVAILEPKNNTNDSAEVDCTLCEDDNTVGTTKDDIAICEECHQAEVGE